MEYLKLCKVLALDISSNTGYSIMKNGELLDHGVLSVTAEDFNVNNYPERSPKYPYNIWKASDDMGYQVLNIALGYEPDYIVIENTVNGKNRNSQRYLEWINKSCFDRLHDKAKIIYLDPSQWRKIIGLRLTTEDKKHNALVSKKKAKGKITRKHLSVRMANELYNTSFKLKDNDIADSVLLNRAANIILEAKNGKK